MKKKTTGYQMTEEDILATINYLRLTKNPDATREDAIEFLEYHQSLAHLGAHKIVEDEKK
jgi:hypothetical protein